MKKALITAACALVSVAAFGQGTIAPDNNNPINDNLGNPLGNGAGTDISSVLLVGPAGATSLSSLTPLASSAGPVEQGYIYGAIVPISGVTAGSTVSYAVEVWSTSAGSYTAAQGIKGDFYGISAINQYATGGAGSPPSIAANLNFASFNANLATGTPEPTTIALGAMGAGALLLFRRRK